MTMTLPNVHHIVPITDWPPGVTAYLSHRPNVHHIVPITDWPSGVAAYSSHRRS